MHCVPITNALPLPVAVAFGCCDVGIDYRILLVVQVFLPAVYLQPILLRTYTIHTTLDYQRATKPQR